MRLLVLGGTTEASDLSLMLAGDARFEAVVSLAGRTTNPRPLPVATRAGGFGGAEGLISWLREHQIEAIVDATHPYAAIISHNAVLAAEALGLPLVSISRASWKRKPGDMWIEVADAAAAAKILGAEPQRVFLSLGRLEIGAFASAPQHHYIARSIDTPGDVPLPPDIRFIFARGPFDERAEHALIGSERIETIVSKNSGGAATYGKIAAARALGIPVVMIARPEKPMGQVTRNAAEALAWLDTQCAHRGASSRRGV